MNRFNEIDIAHMQRAIELAWQGRFSTSPNPRVGCVIAHGAQIVGVGFHILAGREHAEINALKQAGNLARGATAYVTLEPCSHFGRTPPCANALIEAQISRVVIAMTDPNPLVAGNGIRMLKNARITVDTGLLEHEARALNRGFLSRIERHRPFVKMKIAASLDGKTALSNGQSQWITGEHARADVQILRAESCAILTGINTVLADNPRLNVRQFPTLRQPIRIVLDSQLRMQTDCHLIQDGAPTWIITAEGQNDARFLAYPNVRTIPTKTDENQRIALPELLALLAENHIGELMIEAGTTLNSAFLAADLVDELVYYQSPKILGHGARGLFSLPEDATTLTQNPAWQTQAITHIGDDIKWVLHPQQKRE